VTFRARSSLIRSLDDMAVPGMALTGAIYGIAVLAGLAPYPGDAWINWVAPPGTYEGLGLYVYTPVLTQLLEPFRWFDAFELYTVLWMALCFGSLGYVLGPLSYVAALLLIPDLVLHPSERWWAGPIEAVLLGNVTMPMVAAMVAGMRHPGWWSVPLLTKLTPGIGLGWYAFRGEWRQFVLGAGITGGIALVSFGLAPGAWAAYLDFVTSNTGADNNGPAIVGPPLLVRLPFAILVLLWGARTNRPWTVPVAGAIAIVGMYGWGTFTSVACAALSPRLRAAGLGLGLRGDHPGSRGPSATLVRTSPEVPV